MKEKFDGEYFSQYVTAADGLVKKDEKNSWWALQNIFAWTFEPSKFVVLFFELEIFGTDPLIFAASRVFFFSRMFCKTW